MNPYENVLGPSNAGGLAVAWTVRMLGLVESSPAVVDGVAYAAAGTTNGTGNSFVRAFLASTGHLVWARQFQGAATRDVAVANGLLYVGMLDGALHALDAATGADVWSFGAGSFVLSPDVVGGVVYVTDSFGEVFALDAATGAELWMTQLSTIPPSSPTVADGRVYVGSSDHDVYAMDAATGRIKWKAPTGGDVSSTPAVGGGTVYVGSDDGDLYAFDAKTGPCAGRRPRGPGSSLRRRSPMGRCTWARLTTTCTPSTPPRVGFGGGS